MPNNTDHHFDAIVIGAGMTGGWAAKELCENGLQTLMLERGRDVKHIADYPTTGMQPWEFKHRGRIPFNVKKGDKVLLPQYGGTTVKIDGIEYILVEEDSILGIVG